MRTRSRQQPKGRGRAGRVSATLALSVALGAGVTACSDDPEEATASTRPEDVIVSDAEVAQGLADVRAMAAEIPRQLSTDPVEAEQKAEAIYDRWFEFEGTVRHTDTDLYLQMEDGLSGIKAGIEERDADRVQRGMDDLDQAADAYLANQQGGNE
jgi:hypothetical protein